MHRLCFKLKFIGWFVVVMNNICKVIVVPASDFVSFNPAKVCTNPCIVGLSNLHWFCEKFKYVCYFV